MNIKFDEHANTTTSTNTVFFVPEAIYDFAIYFRLHYDGEDVVSGIMFDRRSTHSDAYVIDKVHRICREWMSKLPKKAVFQISEDLFRHIAGDTDADHLAAIEAENADFRENQKFCDDVTCGKFSLQQAAAVETELDELDAYIASLQTI